MDCIFCKIIKGDLPALKIYEDRRALAFLDINPINKGHALVVPKDHYDSLAELPVDLLKELIVVVQRLITPVTEVVGADGFNLGLNNGQAAGQIIHHVHFHIIPRFKGDNLHPWPGKTYQDNEGARIAGSIGNLLT